MKVMYEIDESKTVAEHWLFWLLIVFPVLASLAVSWQLCTEYNEPVNNLT